MSNSGNVEKPKRHWKLSLLVLGIIFFLVMLIGLFKFGSILAFFWFFSWTADKLVATTGMNIWSARSLAIPIAIFFAVVFWLMFSWNTKKRRQGFALLIGSVMLITIGMFFMEKDYVFSSDGTVSKCYAATPTGYEQVPCSWKVHRIYGTPVQAFTQEMAISQWTEKHGLSNVKRVTPTKDLRFFAPDGTPLIWYYQYPDGKLEFFSQPGLHPQLGKVALSPVNAEVVSLLFNYLDQRKFEMIILNGEETIPGAYPKPTTDKAGEEGELGKLRDLLNDLQVK